MTKQEIYQTLLPQIESLVAGETDVIANMANVAAALHEAFGFWWTGFYRVEGQQLVLGPFQGPVACTRIPYGKGVCGTAWQRAETIIVPNVHEFAGHIACSSASNSEIVVPVIRNNQVIAVLDIDSKDFNTFDETDRLYLEQIARLLLPLTL
ncbi:MAG: GAF domain-containing protein [Paludibacteraceae bacterium]|nr:GAF domain-containing protein [Paludibacteraceae bacterium]